ncbi:hypothetical protein M8C21_009560 [Ambrosia artemisiifolia]|uniref:Uncharacterized protein n=1 Tax=Ambrosia artemisiifolia TaxID=4212 RepID=A0AAD5GT08_AMBAR|nr:hypothetical protein M8C21_009560 [Ambrosia artemisiifolia]
MSLSSSSSTNKSLKSSRSIWMGMCIVITIYLQSYEWLNETTHEFARNFMGVVYGQNKIAISSYGKMICRRCLINRLDALQLKN